MRAPLRIQTDVRPVSLDGQASPSSVYESPLGSASWAESVDGASPRVHRASRPTETTARAPSPPPAATSPLVATLPETLSPPAATSSPPRRFVPTPPRASTEQILVSPPAQVAGPSPLPTQVASPSPLPIQAPLPIQHMFPTTSPDLVPTRALSPLPRRLRHHTNASHPSDGSGSDEVVFRGSSSSASSSPAKRRRSHVRRHIGVNGDELARRTMSEGVQPKRASDAGGPRLSEARRTGQALMRRAQTGSGDDEEVSSDGREVVLFIPRAPPPPVPKVPTPPAVGAPSLPVVKIPTPPAAKVPTPPAVKVPTPPAVVVDPPVVRVVPVPPPLVRKESIPLPAASPYPGAAQFDYSPPRPEQLPRSVSPHTEGSFQSVHTADDVLRLPLDDWLEFAMSSMAAMGIPLTRATLEDLHESEDENSGGTLDGVSQADDDSDGDSPSLSLSPVSGMPSPARSGFFSATIPMPPNALRMPRPRLAPAQDTTSHHLARRFLQLDTDIRVS
ncbi:hypothetical protein FS749_014705 [Ceratobasidium sp. UAMH 11750]|nr:hypothetical protein FS749_014705 [Ceratobasidium sp. UAMH 11750]